LPGDVPARGLGDLPGRFLGALRVARPDDHLQACCGPAGRQPPALSTGAAHHADGHLLHSSHAGSFPLEDGVRHASTIALRSTCCAGDQTTSKLTSRRVGSASTSRTLVRCPSPRPSPVQRAITGGSAMKISPASPLAARSTVAGKTSPTRPASDHAWVWAMQARSAWLATRSEFPINEGSSAKVSVTQLGTSRPALIARQTSVQ